jgi:hypothetical protein
VFAGTAFLDFDVCPGVHSAIFRMINVNSSSVYIGVALSTIPNETGFASSNMDNCTWYMRNQGELRCGREDISSTGNS